MEEKEINETAIVPQMVGNGDIIKIEDYEDLISIAQRRIDVVDKFISMSLKITTANDWVNQDGSPYLVHSGAEKVARLFGIKLSNIRTERTWADDTKGKYYLYKTTGTASLPGKFDSIEAVGTCSQRDKFFAKAKGEWKDTIEIDETNILKASYSNFVVNAITHLLGLRNITWDMLKAAKIDVSQIQEVKYQKGSEKLEVTEKDKEIQKKLWDLLMNMTAGNEEEARIVLEMESGFENKDGEKVQGKTDVRYLTGKWLNFTYSKIKKRAEKQEGRMPGEEG